MDLIKEFLATYGTELLYMIITTILTYVGLTVKKIYENHTNEYIKKSIVEDTVKYVEQLYSNKTSEEKYKIAKENILKLLEEKKITVTELELEVLIESACNNIKKNKEEKEQNK